MDKGTRYSRGMGIIGGAAEYSVTGSLAVSTELLAMRNRMANYRMTSTSNLPTVADYTLNSYRLTLGLKFNPLRTSQLAQTPR